VATIGAVLTAHGKPYHYLLVNLEGEKLPYKFMATDIKPAPPLNKIKLTVGGERPAGFGQLLRIS